MRLPGYCTRCGRVGRTVTVDGGRGMIGLAISGVAEGLCDECAADELEAGRRIEAEPVPRRRGART